MGGGPVLKPKSYGTEAGRLGQILLNHCWKHGEEELGTNGPEGIRLNEIKRLVEQGADIDFHDGFGLTPLAGLIFHNHIAGIKYMFEQGAKLNAPDRGLAHTFEEEAKHHPHILKMLLDEKTRREQNTKRQIIFKDLGPLNKNIKRKKASFKK